MILMNPLNNKEFLDNLFAHNEREISVKITVLDFNEQPIECIEGKAIDGTINIDGASAVRRTCNLTIVAEEIDINEFYWGLKNKFKLEIGLKNDVDPLYPEIIWFKQGIFVITQFNTTQTAKKWTIKIQGKDKMCLLNGDVSGNLSFNVDFSHEQYYNKNTNTYTYKEVPIKTIINRALIEFGKELPYNIILNDIDEIGRELLEYRGLSPLYIFKDIDTEEYRQISIKGDLKCYYELKQELTLEQYKSIPEDYSFLLDIYVKNFEGKYIFNNELAKQNKMYQKYNHNGWFEGKISDNFNIIYDDLLEDDEFVGGDEPTIIRFNLINSTYANKRYHIIKINTGEIPGYRLTDLTFAGELKASIGESITSILDKIKNKFTNFEYFYDIDGKFVFQKKREYLTTAWDSSNVKTNLLYNGSDFQNEILFDFIDGKFITSFQNTPKLTDIKNDYSVWGTRDKTTIHMRYAIDDKPISYCPIRPLKEKIMHIYWDANQNYIKEKESYKFYDAPEIEPYNDDGLITCDYGYQFLSLIRKNSNDNVFNLSDYQTIESLFALCPDYELQWLSLFIKQKDKFLYDFIGSYQNIKEIFIMLNQIETINGNTTEITILTEEDGSEEWIINYQYFAKYPYSIDNILDDNNNIVHYKVDWRELIYQMALDYRKLNYTDDFIFYLKSSNPDLIKNNKTNYEQYYTDIEGFWRYLYNPNPELMFESITPLEVQKETLLLDNSSENDFLDQIYIKNPYVVVTEDNIDNITQENLYRYTKAEKSDLYGIYPFTPSDKHHLQLDATYFIESALNNESTDIVMTGHKVETPNSNIPKIEEQVAYNTLNNVDINKIYIKNDQDFITKKASYIIPAKIYQKNVFYIQDNNKNYIISQGEYNKETTYYKYASNQYKKVDIDNEMKNIYQPGHYYIQQVDQNNHITYIISTDKFNDKEIYYSLYWDNGSYEDAFYAQPNLLFKVPYYPYISTLENSANATIADYMLFTEQEFKTIKNNLDSYYYFKDNNNYIKLSECLKDINMSKLYYCSDLYNLSYQTNNILSYLSLIHENAEEKYNTKGINYIEDILKNLNNYNDIIQYKNFNDIKENFIYFISNIFVIYQQRIINFLNNIINECDINNSSLVYLAEVYKKNIENINLKDDLTMDHIIYLIQEINIQIQNFINNINSYYNQVAIVLTYENILIPIENKEEYTLTLFKQDGANLLLTLNSIKNYYGNGQLQKTIFQLENIIKNIDDSDITYTLQNAQDDFKNIILFNINQMTECLNNIEELIFIDIFNYNNLSVYNMLLLYMQHIGKLYQIFDVALNAYNFNEGKNNLISILTFDSDIISLKSLYNNIKKCSDLKTLQNIILNYNESTKVFQEFFIQENINNFNILKDEKINFENIEYQRGFYNYKHDYEEGNYWLLEIYNTPQSLLFWFDFLEPGNSDLTKYSVPLIGSRTKVINDKDVKSMHYKDIPNIIFKSNTFSKDDILPGYNYINITDSFMNLFNISSKSKTAKERIDELLYKHSHCAENINIQVIPVYNLEPNNKIYIQDHECNIQGNYLINKITIPLSYKKMMTITALKAIDESI